MPSVSPRLVILGKRVSSDAYVWISLQKAGVGEAPNTQGVVVGCGDGIQTITGDSDGADPVVVITQDGGRRRAAQIPQLQRSIIRTR
jgi:hypothetical protein